MPEQIGSGRRFRGLEHKLAKRRGVKNPAALAASIGRKKYGAGRFQELAKAGARRAENGDENAAGELPPAGSKRVKI